MTFASFIPIMTKTFLNFRKPIRIVLAGSPIVSYLAWIPSFITAKIQTVDESKFMATPVTDIQHLESHSDLQTKMELLILRIQSDFCHCLEKEESGAKFRIDKWERKNPSEGGGITCVMQDGDVFEKAGVNITVMRAPLAENLKKNMRDRGRDLPKEEDFTFFAAGVSSVIHPRNPHVPTIHFNYRFFQILSKDGTPTVSWFGGGTDLTPYYLDEDDVRHFHSTLRNVCDKHNTKYYPKFKKWCDRYFVNKNRRECRGVGGIFFDDLEDNPEETFKFIEDCADAVIPSYLPIIQKNKNKPYTEEQRRWQLLRRGRYVEFNLVYDRGTKFGFATPGARIESILMSLPLIARWEYRHEPEEGTEEYKLLDVLKHPKNWL